MLSSLPLLQSLDESQLPINDAADLDSLRHENAPVGPVRSINTFGVLVMQKRKLAGGLVAAGVLVGAYFSGMFGKFGGGTGTGTGDATGTKTAVASTRPADPNAPAGPVAKTTAPEAKKPAATDPKQAAPSTAAKSSTTKASEAPATAKAQPERRTLPEKFPVLEVYVKDHRYEVKDPVSGDMLKVLLPDVVTLAKRTTGDESGIRVRINRYRNAKFMAWSNLCAALEAADFEREKDFVMPHQMVEVAEAKPKEEKPSQK